MKKVAILSIILFAVATVASAQPVVVEKYWERLCGVDTATDNVRNLAVWPGDSTLPVEMLVTLHRGAAADAIEIYNPQSGLRNVRNENLDMTGIPSGTYNILAGDFSTEGSFYACNLSYTSTLVLHVYRWATVDATPVEIYNSGSGWLGYRMGDALDVEGAESDNSVKIIISGNNVASQPLVLTTADNGASFSASTLSNPIKAQDIDILSDGTFWATSANTTIAKYNADGSSAGSSLTGTETKSGFAVDETKGWIYTMGFGNNAVLEVYDIASDALLYSATPDVLDLGPGGTLLPFANGSAAVEIVEEDRKSVV